MRILIIALVLIVSHRGDAAAWSFSGLSCRFSAIKQKSAVSPPIKLGPSRFIVNPENAKEIREQEDSFYRSARRFTKEFGKDFAKLVFGHISRDRRTTIAVMMGGAEHLGTLLEMYAHKYNLNHIDFYYLHLNTKMMQSWSALNEDWSQKRSGFGPIPDGWKANGPSEHNLEVLSNYLGQRPGLFSNPNLMVVDTGYQGTTVEALAATSRDQENGVNVEGTLLSKNQRAFNTVPVRSVDGEGRTLRMTFEKPILSPARWASAIDCNNCQGAQVVWDPDAFQRSELFTGFKQSDSGHWIVETTSELEDARKKANYESTLQGLWDGL